MKSAQISKIGRQAEIFEHAETAPMWRSHHNTAQLGQALRDFAGVLGQLEYTAKTASVRIAAEALDLILQNL